MRISIIAALSTNWVIGKAGRLPWHLPADLRFFKEKTLGHPIIMGRKTFESVGRPLPGRRNIIVSRQSELVIEGAEVVSSLDEAIEAAGSWPEVFIAGGSQIYQEALAIAHRMYLTRIHAHFTGDTYFPRFDPERWRESSREDFDADDQNPYPFSFTIYERIG